MDVFYWVLMGLLAGFLAKTSLPAERDENLFGLLAAGVVGALSGGFLMHALARTSASWMGHIAAFFGAVILLVILRMFTSQLPARAH